ncbi:Poly-beta-1,6-N-acetyl-D-glucosamine synthase [bacterium HR11]|nr:Poly-beta-1,6-N-acetyl-D-glucosamine synthase [bacterium HR11]
MDLPLVTVVVPVWNEAAFIGPCLDSVVANDYPKDRLEVLVVDGGSTDGTRAVLEDYARRYPFIRLLDNPGRIPAAALNAGLRQARGDVIVRMDAHTVYAPDYIRKCVELLQTTEAANVGGVQRAVGRGYVAGAIAVALTSPFGVGDARFRYADRLTWADTVYLGAWRRATLEALGGFDEAWAVNEDYELNYRLRRAGGRVLVSPDVRCWYHVRSSLGALARQYVRYGFWRARTAVVHPGSLRWRHLVPPALVLGLVGSAGLGAAGSRWGLVVPILYVVANVGASLGTALRRGLRYLPLLPVVYAVLHLSWGAGFLAGLVRWGFRRT